MQTMHLCVLIHIWLNGEVGAHWNRFKPSSKIFFTDRSKAVLLLWIIYVISVLFLLCFRACLFINALWSPAEKGLTSWLSCVMSNCKVITFPLVSWVRCGAWLYRFLIFALLLTLLHANSKGADQLSNPTNSKWFLDMNILQPMKKSESVLKLWNVTFSRATFVTRSLIKLDLRVDPSCILYAPKLCIVVDCRFLFKLWSWYIALLLG